MGFTFIMSCWLDAKCLRVWHFLLISSCMSGSTTHVMWNSWSLQSPTLPFWRQSWWLNLVSTFNLHDFQLSTYQPFYLHSQRPTRVRCASLPACLWKLWQTWPVPLILVPSFELQAVGVSALFRRAWLLQAVSAFVNALLPSSPSVCLR